MAGKPFNELSKSRQGRQENVVAVRKHLSSLAGLWTIAGIESQP
jgi:hypothetical protein